jgi:glutathione S-transferase
VPTLRLDDGDVLTEGAVIVQYIADQADNKTLAPAAGTKERLKVQEWLNYIASELHKGFSPLFNPATPDAYKAIVKTNLAKQFAYLEKSLAGKDYLTGKNFTVADAYLFTILNWRHMHNIDISAYKNLSAYLDRVGARPKVKEAMQSEGLLKAA